MQIFPTKRVLGKYEVDPRAICSETSEAVAGPEGGIFSDMKLVFAELMAFASYTKRGLSVCRSTKGIAMLTCRKIHIKAC